MLYVGLVIILLVGWVIKDLTNFWFGLAFLIAASSAFIKQGIEKVKNDPIHYALYTLFGKRRKKIKKEGYRFFALNPWVEGFIEIKVEKVNQDLKEQIVRTPDLASISIPVSLTWTPAYEIYKKTSEGEKKRQSPELIIEYLNTGGETGVKTILEDVVHERLREWAFSQREGPQTWQQAMAARAEAIAILLKAILGEELRPVRAPFPTSVLMKYFDHERPTEQEEKKYGPLWKKIDDEFSTYSPEKTEEIKDAVEERRKAIQLARQGNGHFACPQLGVVINRLNVGEIKPLGDLAKVAELQAKEEQERRGEVYEVNTDILKAYQLMRAARKTKHPLIFPDAYRIILEWKATREGHGFAIPGISPAIIELAKTFFRRRDK